MVAALAIARRSTSCLSRANVAGGGLWPRAPLPSPTRYGFSVQEQEAIRVTSLASFVSRGGVNPWGSLHSGGMRPPWALALASYSTRPGGYPAGGGGHLSGGGGHLSGGGGRGNGEMEELKCLFMKQMATEKNRMALIQSMLTSHTEMLESFGKSVVQPTQIEEKDSVRTWVWVTAFCIVIFLLICTLAWWFFIEGAEMATKLLRDFLSDQLSMIIKDPKVQDSVVFSAGTFVNAGIRKLNPWLRLKDWTGGEEARSEKASVDDILSRTTCLSFFILLILGSKQIDEAGLIRGLHSVGMTEVELIKETTALLVTMGYLEKVIIKGPAGEDTVFYVASKNSLKAFASGEMQQKMRKAVGRSRWN